jgi:hypothetical protein
LGNFIILFIYLPLCIIREANSAVSRRISGSVPKQIMHFYFLSVTLTFFKQLSPSFNLFLSQFSSVSPSCVLYTGSPGPPGSDPPRGCPQDGRRTRQAGSHPIGGAGAHLAISLVPLQPTYRLITPGKQETISTSQKTSQLLPCRLASCSDFYLVVFPAAHLFLVPASIQF